MWYCHSCLCTTYLNPLRPAELLLLNPWSLNLDWKHITDWTMQLHSKFLFWARIEVLDLCICDVLAALPSDTNITAIEQEQLKAGAYRVQRTSIEAEVRRLTTAIGTARSKRRNNLSEESRQTTSAAARSKTSRSRTAAPQLGRPAKETIFIGISPSRYISFCVRRTQRRYSRIPNQIPIGWSAENDLTWLSRRTHLRPILAENNEYKEREVHIEEELWVFILQMIYRCCCL